MSELKAKTVNQVIETIIRKVEKYAGKIDFKYLSEWCKGREGQTIVCENTKADWLPFSPVTKLHGAMSETVEAIWSNHKTNYDNVQASLFD